MSVTAVSELFSAATSTAAAAVKKSSVPGKDDFLKLLVAQMRNQNPLEPVKDGEFLAQLAQFSNLEATQQLNKSFSDMLVLQQMTQGANLIGKTVVYTRPEGNLTSRGVVEAVKMENNAFTLVIDGKSVSLAQVRGIEKP